MADNMLMGYVTTQITSGGTILKFILVFFL